MSMMHVAATSMNLRSQPGVKPGTIIATLRWAQPVDVLADAPLAGWKQLRAKADGNSITGFGSAKLLRESVSAKKEALIAEAVAQWERFDHGKGKEDKAPYFRFVGEMWQALGIDLDGTDTDTPWSAAFISFVVRRAGYQGFMFAAAHSKYINDSIVKRQAGQASPFWGFRISEHKPGLGDMVCRTRTAQRITYDFAASHSSFKSHCDIVVALEPGAAVTIGGNVSNSVSVTRYKLDATGQLDADGGRVFAVLRNNL